MPSFVAMQKMAPANAPTDIKPAWPKLSSPEIPTTRFSDTAITMYTQMGTSCPFNERLIRPAFCRSVTATKATITIR